MSNPISLSARWHQLMSCFVRPTVQAHKIVNLLQWKAISDLITWNHPNVWHLSPLINWLIVAALLFIIFMSVDCCSGHIASPPPTSTIISCYFRQSAEVCRSANLLMNLASLLLWLITLSQYVCVCDGETCVGDVSIQAARSQLSK